MLFELIGIFVVMVTVISVVAYGAIQFFNRTDGSRQQREQELAMFNDAVLEAYQDAMVNKQWIMRALKLDSMHLYQRNLLQEELQHVEFVLDKINSLSLENEEELVDIRRANVVLNTTIGGIMCSHMN